MSILQELIGWLDAKGYASTVVGMGNAPTFRELIQRFERECNTKPVTSGVVEAAREVVKEAKSYIGIGFDRDDESRGLERAIDRLEAALANTSPATGTALDPTLLMDCIAARKAGGTGPICDMCAEGRYAECRWNLRRPSGWNARGGDTTLAQRSSEPCRCGAPAGMSCNKSDCPQAILGASDDTPERRA